MHLAFSHSSVCSLKFYLCRSKHTSVTQFLVFIGSLLSLSFLFLYFCLSLSLSRFSLSMSIFFYLCLIFLFLRPSFKTATERAALFQSVKRQLPFPGMEVTCKINNNLKIELEITSLSAEKIWLSLSTFSFTSTTATSTAGKNLKVRTTEPEGNLMSTLMDNGWTDNS